MALLLNVQCMGSSTQVIQGFRRVGIPGTQCIDGITIGRCSKGKSNWSLGYIFHLGTVPWHVKRRSSNKYCPVFLHQGCINMEHTPLETPPVHNKEGEPLVPPRTAIGWLGAGVHNTWHQRRVTTRLTRLWRQFLYWKKGLVRTEVINPLHRA